MLTIHVDGIALLWNCVVVNLVNAIHIINRYEFEVRFIRQARKKGPFVREVNTETNYQIEITNRIAVHCDNLI